MKKLVLLLTCIMTSVACLGLCTPAYSGLISHWKFDEANGETTAVDSAGGLNVSFGGYGSEFVADTERGEQVVSFSGTGFLSRSISSAPLTASMNYTVGFWAKTADDNDRGAWLAWGSSSSTGRYFIGLNTGNTVYTAMGTSSTGPSVTLDGATSALETDAWQYWTFVRDNIAGTMTVYVNGTQVDSKPQTVGDVLTLGNLRIGQMYTGSTNYTGMMDDLAIWDETLTIDQISNAKNYGAENYAVPEPSTVVLLIAGMFTFGYFRRRGC